MCCFSRLDVMAIPIPILTVEPNDVITRRRDTDAAPDLFGYFFPAAVYRGNGIDILESTRAPLGFTAAAHIGGGQHEGVVGIFGKPGVRRLFVGQRDHFTSLLRLGHGTVASALFPLVVYQLLRLQSVV